MDVLEVLVLLIALVLIALVVAVVLVVGQAMASGKDDENDDADAQDASDAASESDVPLVQPAESVPAIEEAPQVAEVTATAAPEPVQAAPVASQPEPQPVPQPAYAVSEPPVSEAMHTQQFQSSPQHNQTHRVNEERPVDSDRHNKRAPHHRSIADDEIRRPAVEAGNNSVSEQDESFPYMSGGPLLSPIERLFYGDLKTSVSEKTEIFIKVRASDVINPKSDLSFEETQFAAEQLATQRFDFVLCDSTDFSVLCVIELDGLSEREGLRRIQREILRKAAESANVPVLLVDMKRGYTIKEIRDRVSYLLPKETEAFIAESYIGQNKRKIADLITEVDEPEDVPQRQFAHTHSAFEEAENNSINQFGNASHQHQRPTEAPSAYRDHYAQQDTNSHQNTMDQGNGHYQPSVEPRAERRDAPPVTPQQQHTSQQHTPPPRPAEPRVEANHTHHQHTQPGAGAFAEAAEGMATKCPRCASPLKMSMATTGEFAGQYFWICTKLPECPYVAPISPPQ